MIKSLLLPFLIAISSAICFGQSRFDSVNITHTILTEKLYMLEGSGGNMGLYVGENEVLLIDDQYGPLSEKIMQKVKDISGREVTRIINTHWHGDHTGGNENFGKAGAMIIAHENVRKRMSTEQVRGERVTPASPAVALPVITYSEEMQLYFMGEPVLITHVHNGHTDGDSFIYFPESKVAHLGDCFFHKRFPYIDTGSGGSIDGMITAIETAMMILDDDTQIIPGHGPMATKEDLSNYLTFLKTVRERVFSYISNGRGQESIDPAKIVEGYEDLAWGFIDAERFTGIVYASLTQANN